MQEGDDCIGLTSDEKQLRFLVKVVRWLFVDQFLIPLGKAGTEVGQRAQNHGKLSRVGVEQQVRERRGVVCGVIRQNRRRPQGALLRWLARRKIAASGGINSTRTGRSASSQSL